MEKLPLTSRGLEAQELVPRADHVVWWPATHCPP